MSNLQEAISIWIQHISNTFKQNNNYDGRSISGFKNGKNTSKAYETISNTEVEKSITVDNMNEIFFNRLIELDPEQTDEITYNYVVKILNTKQLITKTTTQNQDKLILKFKQDAEEFYNQNAIATETTSVTPNNRILRSNNIETTLMEQNIIKSLSNMFEKSLAAKFVDFEAQLSQKLNFEQSSQQKERKSLESCSEMELKRIIHFRIKKTLRFKNDLAIFSEHDKQKSLPKSLQTSRFPTPFLPHNEKLVEEHDNLIAECQAKLIELNKSHLNEAIVDLEEELKQLRIFLAKFIKDETSMNTFVNSIYETATKELKPSYDAGIQKVIRLVGQNITNMSKLKNKFNSNEINSNKRNDFKSNPGSVNHSYYEDSFESIPCAQTVKNYNKQNKRVNRNNNSLNVNQNQKNQRPNNKQFQVQDVNQKQVVNKPGVNHNNNNKKKFYDSNRYITNSHNRFNYHEQYQPQFQSYSRSNRFRDQQDNNYFNYIEKNDETRTYSNNYITPRNFANVNNNNCNSNQSIYSNNRNNINNNVSVSAKNWSNESNYTNGNFPVASHSNYKR